ncbi:acyltransferase family protein [Caballeronia insecticola]|uniref:Probable acetyltransferase protein n=1 Tax=Caballeronia insecticola TaxID=758793 RepID=R4WZD4_9BURK|nr:acyltransferase [Caballeronia insecticola]BAN23757.1 probable acetyltransferase protein [Caballeronia insecticola]
MGFRQGITLADRIEQVGSASSGFDYLRIGLAIGVVCWHSIVTTQGFGYEQPLWDSWRMLIGGLLPMFFALSGFLVSGSLVRTKSIGRFLSLRAIRLYPALAVEVLLSALILGPLLTKLPLSEYFSRHEFWAYFHNIIGYITFPLPGLFDDNPFPSITNVSLWTIPFELECYICLTVFALIGLKRRFLLLLAVCVMMVCATYMLAHRPNAIQFDTPPGRLLVGCFLGGVLAYLYRDRIPFSGGLFALALALHFLLTRHAWTAYLSIFPTAYVTAWLGLLNPPKRTFLLRGDYSYGLYLFAFPIQQAYAQLFPQHRVIWLATLCALAAGLAYAAFSWHCVEKPILKRKNEIIATAGRMLRPVARALSFAWPAMSRQSARGNEANIAVGETSRS